VQQEPPAQSRSSGVQPEETVRFLLNALTIVRGNAQLIERRLRLPGASDPEVISASVGRIIDAADRMTRSVSALVSDAAHSSRPRTSSDRETSPPDRSSPPSSSP